MCLADDGPTACLVDVYVSRGTSELLEGKVMVMLHYTLVSPLFPYIAYLWMYRSIFLFVIS